ncbi:MAG: hypothetical protein R2787_13845 [Saprospiraceae bacterium]
MKQFLLKSVTLVALVLGSLFFVPSQASAQSNGALVAGPSTNQVWVSNSQALQTVQDEIAAITQELNVLIQNQAPEAEIKQLKYRLQFYMMLQDALNQGIHISEAMQVVKSSLSGTDGTDFDAKKAEKVQQLYDEIVTKFGN